MHIISPKEDSSFKILFHNETVRKYFISDVLEIPVEYVRMVRLVDTGLIRQFRNQKLGILDVKVEFNDNTRVNIEIQRKKIRYWKKRQLYYLTKMYSMDLMMGEQYEKLKKSITIGILDYNLNEQEEYHNVYRLRDKDGNEYSDEIEVHIIELRKKLKGKPVDEWIKLFNVVDKEGLDMLQAQTKNLGILEAIREIRKMSFGRRLRVTYEEYLKEKRDRYAYEEACRDEGRVLAMTANIIQILELKGMVPEELRQRILAEDDLDKLNAWVLEAAKAESLEEFEKYIEI